MVLFRLLWCIDAIASAIILYFFFVGLADGTVSADNMGLWLIILIVVGAVIGGSIWLRSHQHPVLALLTLCVIAVPSFLYGLFILIFILSGSKWN